MTCDIRTLDLNLLKTLDALLAERSVTRAAARLGLTQPAVSGMLARLRDSFDDPLFARTARGIVPTPRAQQLAGPLRRMLSEVEGLLQPPTFDPASAEATLSLAATDYALQAVVVPFLARLRQAAPGIRVAVRAAEDAHAATLFETGALDLALMTPETAPPELMARRLFEETYVVALREDHPQAATPLTLDRFCALDHALVSLGGGAFEGVTDTALAAMGRRRRVVLSIASFLMLAEVLRTTDLVAVAPRRLVEAAPGLVARPTPLPVPGFTKLAVWHERSHRDPAQRWLRALLFETCGDGMAREGLGAGATDGSGI